MDEPCERTGPRNERRWCWWRWGRAAKPWGYRGDVEAAVFDRLAGGWVEAYDGGERKCRIYETREEALADRWRAAGDAAPLTVYLLTTGDGSDGDEWHVRGIYTTREKAEAAKAAYDSHRHFRPDGSWYALTSNDIEEWETDEPPIICPQPGYDPGELHVGCPRCRGTFREPA